MSEKKTTYDRYSPFYRTSAHPTKNKNTGHVSVTGDLIHVPDNAKGTLRLKNIRFRIKLLTCKDKWLALEDKFLRSNGKLSFDDIKPYIRASKQNLHLTESYNKEAPEDFSWDIYTYFIRPAMSKIKVINHRGGSSYGLEWLQMQEIKNTARWVYVFLSYGIRGQQMTTLKC